MTKTSRLSGLLQAGSESLGAIRSRFDGWFNMVTGLGTARDKSIAAEFEPEPPIDPQTLENLYHHNDLAATVVSAVVEDSLRQGYDLNHEEEGSNQGDADSAQEAAKTINKRLEALGFLSKTAEAWTWGRNYGLGAILLGVEGGGLPETPLDDEKITGLRFLTVLDKRDLTPEKFYSDPLGPKFGQVEVYLLQPTGYGYVAAQSTLVHETRLVMFGGATTSRRERERNQQCDHSVLQKVLAVLRDCNQNWDSMRAMMADMSQAVFKISGLLDAIAEGTEGTKSITTRVALMDMWRSVSRAVVLDAGIPGQEVGEDFDVKSRQMAGIADLMDRTWVRLAAAAKMPVTRMFGQAPAGLNATGAEDRRTWYDNCEAERTFKCKPQMDRVVRIVARVEVPSVKPSGWSVKFPSLWSMSPSEEAEHEVKMVGADDIRIQRGVALPEEVAISRSRKNGYRLPLQLELKARKKALALELEDMTKPQPALPVPAPGQPPAKPGALPAPPPNVDRPVP